MMGTKVVAKQDTQEMGGEKPDWTAAQHSHQGRWWDDDDGCDHLYPAYTTTYALCDRRFRCDCQDLDLSDDDGTVSKSGVDTLR